MAKKFRFKLQSVLRYREMLEEDAKREFAKANQAVEEQRHKEMVLQAERTELLGSLREISAGGEIHFGRLMSTFRYMGGLETGIASARSEAERLSREAEESRQAFVARRRDRKSLEILKEKRHEDYQKEEDRQQQLTLDELSLRMLHRRAEEEQQRARALTDFLKQQEQDGGEEE